MTDGQVSLWISVLSIGIAALALGWNIFRDVILKPRLRVELSIKNFTVPSWEDWSTHIVLTGTNHGPGKITVSSMAGREAPFLSRVLRQEQYFYVHPDFENPLCDTLPKTLAEGEQVRLLFPYDEECFLKKDEITHMGLTDTYGKVHWCRKRDVRTAQTEWQRQFRNGG